MIEQTQSSEQTQNAPVKKIWYKRWWAIMAGVFIFMIIIGNSEDNKKQEEKQPTQVAQVNTANQESKNAQEIETKAKQETEDKTKNVPAEYKSALNKAVSYSETMHMSKQSIYNQLTSEYGEKFSTEAAKYAIDNMTADWNANALVKAKNYQDTMNMSPAAIRDQLTSEYGEKFTKSEADYAIQHLNE